MPRGTPTTPYPRNRSSSQSLPSTTLASAHTWLQTIASYQAEPCASHPIYFRSTILNLETGFGDNGRHIPVKPPPPSTLKSCKEPIKALTTSQLSVLDPTGARTQLIADSNPEKVQPGDILHVRFRDGDPFSGILLAVRRRNSPIDSALLLRNQLTRVSVEMWVKIYSPNVEGIEVVERRKIRVRRNKLFYLRQPKHDVGSVGGVVRQYLRQKQGLGPGKGSGKGKAGSGGKGSGKR